MSIKSKNGNSVYYTQFRSSGADNEWNKMKSDLGEVIDYLKKEKGLKGEIKLVGASIGANTVLNYAADNPAIKTIVLLSPGLNYHDVSISNTAPKCAGKNILLVASKGDSYSANSCRQIKDIILAEQAKQKMNIKDNIKYIELLGSEHGTKMLDSNLIKEIVGFLKK
jgi:dienelactone hydrolase